MSSLSKILTAEYWEYPQTWYFMPRWRPLRSLLQRLHGFWGHSISKTEWGYGGGGMVDCNCRWCDAHIGIPLAEAEKHFQMLRKFKFEGLLSKLDSPTDSAPVGSK